MHDPPPEADRFASLLVDAALAVHKGLGPGFLEAVYEEALCIELTARHVPHARQVVVQTIYRDQVVGQHRLDLVVGGMVLVELKAVEALHPLHVSQVISYLRSTRLALALLINFNVRLLRSGVRRIVYSQKVSQP